MVQGKPRLLAQLQLGTAATLIYQAPAQPPNALVEITSLTICNTDILQRKATIRLGKGTLTAANSLLDAAIISPNTSYFLFDNAPFNIEAGVKLEGLADAAAKITVTLFGNVWTG